MGNGEISAESLFDILQEEKRTGEIKQLPKDFYKKAAQHMQTSFDGQYVANFKKLLTGIKERRVQKVLIYLAYNKQLPAQVPEEEERLYRSIKTLLVEKQESMDGIKKIKILTDLPEVLTTRGSKVGPYKQNQVVELTDDTDVDFLVNNKLGEII